jgi:hypothetical protein
MYFWSGEKYVVWGRRKICTFGPAKNMYFWSGEKHVLLVRRKICTFCPAKNMYFWSGEKYVLLVRLAKKKQSPAEKKKDLFGGYWLLAIGHWLVASGYQYWLLAVGYWLLAIGYQPRTSHLRRWQERSVARTHAIAGNAVWS